MYNLNAFLLDYFILYIIHTVTQAAPPDKKLHILLHLVNIFRIVLSIA